eukprot:COSAG06_NODE_13159_length_1287_cov_1.830808_1_plen_102_part_10
MCANAVNVNGDSRAYNQSESLLVLAAQTALGATGVFFVQVVRTCTFTYQHYLRRSTVLTHQMRGHIRRANLDGKHASIITRLFIWSASSIISLSPLSYAASM